MSSPPSSSETSPHSFFPPHTHASALLAFRTRSMLSRLGPMSRWRRQPKEDQNILLESYSKDRPQIPSYLKGTNYESLLNEQYKLYLAKYPTNRGSENSAIALDDDHSTYASILESLDLRLPTAWSQKDRDKFIDMDSHGLQLTYKGKYYLDLRINQPFALSLSRAKNRIACPKKVNPFLCLGLGDDESEMATVRANFPMRPQCGIFYFEIEILSQGCDIGFCWSVHGVGQQLETGREHAWRYHASDGHIYSGTNTSKSYGPSFGTGDVIGCGIDFRDMTAFYTKNGVHLGIAFHNIKGGMIFPTVGFESPGDRIHTNFGGNEFLFDISQYLKDEKTRSFQAICRQSLRCSSVSATPLHVCEAQGEDQSIPISADIVKDYLQHYGFVNTYEAFKRDSVAAIPPNIEVAKIFDKQDKDMIRRKGLKHIRVPEEIMDAVRRIDVDSAIQLFDTYYPDIAKKVQPVLFGLRCRKFVELVWKASKKATAPNDRTVKSGGAAPMEMDDMEDRTTPQVGNKRRRSVLENGEENIETDSDDDMYATEGMREAMEYGRKLTRIYNKMEVNKCMESRLKEAFSVLAYKFPADCPPGFYNDPTWIESMVDALNTKIVSESGRCDSSILERIYRQTEAAVTELECYGDGNAAMVEPRQNFLS
ncbi:hypothetical protein EC973_002825 [Apophysomyces ossiformis]|uniref:B30.2/SPRY domain-containing protein n=1 Tax=Apophysomyces ossiformis TaxID=679940 RepID=A0A8H7BN83_9FUNG|nr:hypothetical protein EC973_002825 [Apophysomyces ossiformis]